MNADERSEIAASVAAHAELGPQYDAAVAEGLVERIGAEIDRRIDARLRGAPAQPAQPAPPPRPSPPPAPAPNPMPPYLLPHLMQQQMPPAPAQVGPQPVPAHRGTGATIASVILALGSMGMGIGATAVIATHVQGGAGFIIFLVWLAIVIVNGMHARFYWRPDEPRRGHKG